MPLSQYDFNILIIDGGKNVSSIIEILTTIGYKSIDVAADVTSAIQKIENNHYELIMLNVNFGGIHHGIDLAVSIKEGGREHLPILFLADDFSEVVSEKAKEVEAVGYLLQPFSESEIKTTLNLIFFQKAQHTYTLHSFSRTLLKNHPNLILRIGINGELLFLNPIISRFTGKTPLDYKGKTIFDAELRDDFVAHLKLCIDTAIKKNRKFSLEFNVATIFGERMMMTIAMPEFTNDSVSSVVLLIQDITDQKIATMDLMLRNKKITDSVNYSKKIQSALIPDSNKLGYYMSNSSIVLKPKDVVSGDFPWVLKKDDYVYVAAVDCTGHGVPGAFMSVIVHFLLNEIIELNDALTPGKILEILHVYTKRTLKQHLRHIESNDGADIGLCRIDTRNSEVIYAGAHRPLLYANANGVVEIKGDKQPIGGEHYSRKKKRLYFTNQQIQYSEGDVFLMFSDGLTDQFGGTSKPPMKFGTLNVKNILEKNHYKHAHHINTEIETAFEQWKTEQKQLDDVLLVCFKPE